MFHKLFDPENAVFRGFGRALDVMVLSAMWVVLCLPVVTLGPATTALYYASVKCLRRGQPAPYLNFLRCFRDNFKTGALAGLLLTAGGAALWLEHNLLVRMASGGSGEAVVFYYAFCVVASLLVGAACYVFPVLSRFTCTLGSLFVRSAQLALRHLPTTLLLAALHLGAAWICLSFWIYLVPLLVVPVATALIASLPLERVLRRYVRPEDMPEGEERPWYLK